MMQVETTIQDGTVVIPAAVREALHLRDGDTLVFDTAATTTSEQETVRLHVRRRQRASFQEFVGLGDDREDKSIEQILAEERERRGY